MDVRFSAVVHGVDMRSSAVLHGAAHDMWGWFTTASVLQRTLQQRIHQSFIIYQLEMHCRALRPRRRRSKPGETLERRGGPAQETRSTKRACGGCSLATRPGSGKRRTYTDLLFSTERYLFWGIHRISRRPALETHIKSRHVSIEFHKLIGFRGVDDGKMRVIWDWRVYVGRSGTSSRCRA